ncbi:hypothetical protein Ahy_B01g053625 isoform A [Arachis hypogaea]|uniref:Uncharacterized protein n=1 Tax=Arachis hypogaea TaxID=3818 RepID=A0A445AS47_ARAHY|nr:hypothetical protein Ahy_B01g053625 isoform A [Arachis hypogaea]
MFFSNYLPSRDHTVNNSPTLSNDQKREIPQLHNLKHFPPSPSTVADLVIADNRPSFNCIVVPVFILRLRSTRLSSFLPLSQIDVVIYVPISKVIRQGRNENMAEPAALSSSKASSMATRKFNVKVEELLDCMLACLALCKIPSLSSCSPSSSLFVSPPIPAMFAKMFGNSRLSLSLFLTLSILFERMMEKRLVCETLLEFSYLLEISTFLMLRESWALLLCEILAKHAESDPFVSDATTKVEKFAQRKRFRYGHDTIIDGMIKDGLWNAYNDFGMGVCADQHVITRDEQVV